MNAISSLSSLLFSLPESNQAKDENLIPTSDSLPELSKKLNLDMNNTNKRIYRPGKNQITDYNDIFECHCQTYNLLNSIFIFC
jgi:hypothetical protein